MKETRSTYVQLAKIEHRGKTIIGLHFQGRRDWLEIIKTLEGIRFSRTHGIWYLPYTKIAFKRFKVTNIPFSLPSTQQVQVPTKAAPLDVENTGISTEKSRVSGDSVDELTDTDIHLKSKVNVEWNSRRFGISLKYTKGDIEKVKKLEGSWWNAKQQKWLCKDSLKNLERIQELWKPWTEERFEDLFRKISSVSSPCKIKLYYSPANNSCFCVKVIGYGANHELIKSMSNRRYNSQKKLYLLPFTQHVVQETKKGYEDLGYVIIDNLPHNSYSTSTENKHNGVTLYLSKINGAYYSSISRMAEGMVTMNYGLQTIKSYCGKLVRILEHTGKKKMEDVSVIEVKFYLDELSKTGISYSLINQVYSAVKLYFDRIAAKNSFELDSLKRPRHKVSLPKFLSESEVIRLIGQIDNLKHLAIVYLLYGSGMRRNELLNLQLKDVYWDRGQLLIEKGKGGQDRMVNLSHEAKRILEAYFDKYQPRQYVFEGVEPGKMYSGGSVGNIIRNAATRAGMTKRVTAHMLRHSFATHLMDRGVALPKIQKLLGHKSIKTTLIYTHVTNADISSVTSPLDVIEKRLKR